MKDQVHELIKQCDELLQNGIHEVAEHYNCWCEQCGEYELRYVYLDVELIKSIAVCQELNPVSLTGKFKPVGDNSGKILPVTED